uniref:C2H2-type domain-containing protein n=1 Tax=Lutzomyia longipalpis TaxID=7200 RepID=A0A1B0CN36_LUTLO
MGIWRMGTVAMNSRDGVPSEECTSRRITDFSISSILRKDDPPAAVPRITRRPLNKVFESPWASQCPVVFNPVARVVGEYQCEASFVQSPSEKSHRATKYECEECGKGFSQLRNYKYHISIHRGTKEFAAHCPECGKMFNDKGYLSTICGKTFADRSNMTLHQRLHSGIKPFSCPLCPKAFTKKHHLKTHLNYHTGYKPYHCPHPNCGQSFTQSSNMRTHAKKCHFQPPPELPAPTLT